MLVFSKNMWCFGLTTVVVLQVGQSPTEVLVTKSLPWKRTEYSSSPSVLHIANQTFERLCMHLPVLKNHSPFRDTSNISNRNVCMEMLSLQLSSHRYRSRAHSVFPSMLPVKRALQAALVRSEELAALAFERGRPTGIIWESNPMRDEKRPLQRRRVRLDLSHPDSLMQTSLAM